LEFLLSESKVPRYINLRISGYLSLFSDTSGRMNCPLDPFFVLPDSCKCVDSQTLKLQETPENVPNGEIPRHISLYVDKYLCDKIVPGNRVTVTGIYSIKRVGPAGKVRLHNKNQISVK